MSHPVPYRRSDLRCGWVSPVAGHKGKQFQRAGNNLEKAEPWESGAAQQKPPWGLGEETLQASPAFQMLVSLEEHPAKSRTWGPKLQRDRSSKDPKHLLIQLQVSRWDVLP